MLRLFRRRPKPQPAPSLHLERTYWATHRDIERLLAERSNRAAA